MPATAEIFARTPNCVFVETGSYLGDGIQAALDAGFQRVISIELSDKYFALCQERFANDVRVTLVQGDSALILGEVISQISTNITFWLDGHYSAGDTAQGVVMIPLLEELQAIADHPIKTHTLLIDDMRCWKDFNPAHGFQETDVLAALHKIREDVPLEWIDSPHAPRDILIARFAESTIPTN
jgi:hypothetical protein